MGRKKKYINIFGSFTELFNCPEMRVKFAVLFCGWVVKVWWTFTWRTWV